MKIARDIGQKGDPTMDGCIDRVEFRYRSHLFDQCCDAHDIRIEASDALTEIGETVMTYRSSKSFLAGLILAGSLAAGPLAVSRAVAQEAIMLESIGAVRMVRPEEVKRTNDDAIAQRQRIAPATTVAERHAAIVE